VHQEAPGELVRSERHRLPAAGSVDAVVLPAERDPVGVGGDQPAVGDGNAMGIAREIAQDLFWPRERLLGVDHPLSPAQRRQEALEGSLVGERGMVAEEGEAGTVIHRILQHQGADLVMMPTRGDAPLRRFLLGSVTAKVLHDVSAAVWTGVGSALEKHQPSVPYKSIVCALDESEEAEAVLRAAAVVAKSYKAALALVHVLEMPPATPEMDFNIYRKELIDAAHTRMRDLKTRLNLDAPDTVIDVGIPDSIHEEIVRRKAGLLVVGRGHDQGAISRVWSRLYAIVRDSPCPVLSI